MTAPQQSQGLRHPDWPAGRHVRHLAVYEQAWTVPAVRLMIADAAANDAPETMNVERLDAAWDPCMRPVDVDVELRTLAEARFALLQMLETASDEAWARPIPARLAPAWIEGTPSPTLTWLVAHSYWHELEHLAELWRLALFSDRLGRSSQTATGVRFHPADTREMH